MTARILMCGEGGSNLELYKASLEDEGHAVEIVPAREASVAALGDGGFDLVITDLEDAEEASTRYVHELSAAGAAGVLAVLPDMPGGEEAEKLRQVGAREFLVRPFSMTRLGLSVENALERARMLGELEAGGPPASDVAASSPASPPAVLAAAAPNAAPVSMAAAAAELDAQSHRVQELEGELERARRRAKETELERTRLEELEAKAESLKGQVRRKEQEVARLREDLQAAQEDQASARERLEQVEARAAKAEEEARTRLAAAEDEAQARLAAAKDEAQARLTAAKDEARESRDQLQQEIDQLMQELRQRSERHKQQLELLSQDEASVQANYEERFKALTAELESTRARLESVVHEKEELVVQMNEDRGAFKSLRTHMEDAQREAEEVRRSRDELQKRLENEIRKRFNEVRALVQERKKLIDENRELAQGVEKELDEERSARKQLEVELESLKTSLPTERKKVHALVEYQRSLIENVLAGILTVDTSGIITLGNELAAKHLDTKLSDLLGTHVDQNTAFAPLRPLFAEALTSDGQAGPASFEIRPGVSLRAVATKVPFGPRELILLSFLTPEEVEVPGTSSMSLDDEGPLARLGAAVAGNITDVQDFAIEIRGYLERTYGKTAPDSPAREETNGALRKVGELIDFLRDIIEQAESYLS